MVIGEARLPTGPVISKEPAYLKVCDKYADPLEIPEHEWRKVLSADEYYVCRLGGTEPSFSGILTKHNEAGVYNCRCCGADLFLSDNKYYAGCGWPAFNSSYDEDRNITRQKDTRFGLDRTEVRCKQCNSHLGHIFEDENSETGERYCINSVSINFEK